jgi:hypothetical protein
MTPAWSNGSSRRRSRPRRDYGARIGATGNRFTPVQLTGLIERVLGKHPDLA